MFEIGDYVVYGTKGVCIVQNITMLQVPGEESEREYYVLQPIGDKGATVYLPVDNKKAVIRSVISGDEARELLKEIPEIQALDVPDDKKREVRYKEAMKTCDCRVWVSIIKALYIRRDKRIAMGKKVTALDEKYLKAAEHELYNELSVTLDISNDEMKAYIEANTIPD